MNQGFQLSDLTVKVGTIGSCVAACVGLEFVLESFDVAAPYLVFLPVIAGACAISGLGDALWAIFFSAAGLWYFFIPPNGFAVPSICDIAHLGIFVVVSVFVCWVIDGLRRANNDLSRDNFVLGCKVSNLLTRAKASQ